MACMAKGWERFWEAHVLIDLGLPDFFGLDDVTWFSAINIAAMLISIAGTALTERLLPRMHPPQLLPWLYGLLAAALLAFALAPAFGAGMAAFLCMIFVSSPIMPMFEAYFNQHLQSETRATMLSFNSQVSSVGRHCGSVDARCDCQCFHQRCTGLECAHIGRGHFSGGEI